MKQQLEGLLPGKFVEQFGIRFKLLLNEAFVVFDNACQNKRNAFLKEGLPVAYIQILVIIINVNCHSGEIVQQIGCRSAVDDGTPR